MNPLGIKVPYIVTISEDNGKVLSIRRNYLEDDPMQAKIQYFVHYKFLGLRILWNGPDSHHWRPF